MFKRRPSNRQAIQEFNRSLLLIVDPDALQASIAGRIREHFQPEIVIILQLDRESGFFLPSFVHGVAQDVVAGMRLQGRGKLARWLLINETCLHVPKSPGVYEYLSQPEQDLFVRLSIQLCVPLISLNRLAGIILLGSAKADWELTKEDVGLLELLAHQAGLAFENASLYQQQRDRLRRLYRAERLAAAGQLAADVAHEIRNPLTAIRSTIQYLLTGLEAQDARRELVSELLSEVDRIDRTVNGLLTLARPGEFHPQEMNLIDVLEQSLVLIGSQAKSQGVQLERQFAREHFRVRCDAGQLKQVFLNLFLNALYAMPEGGVLRVAVGGWRPDIVPHPGEWVQIRIEDSGSGIDPATLEKIFDPFFTTKREGTGLGLSICHSIIQHHQGEIEIQSEIGRGTTALIRLPMI